MRLDDAPAPAPTGAMYHARQPGTQEALNIDVSSLQTFPEALTPSNGDCLYASIHRQYFLFETNFPQSFAVMQQRLRAFCAPPNNLDEPVQTPLPLQGDDEPTREEADQFERWRKIIAKQLELHWDWYDIAHDPAHPELEDQSQRYELDGHLDWLYNPGAVQYRGEDALRNAARRALEDSGGVPPAKTTVLADRKRVVLTMTQIPTMWAYGYEADAIADILGIFIHTWLHTAGDGNLELSTRSRAHGPRGDEAAALATAYGSGGYVPRFNLLKTRAHYSYQEIDRRRGVANNRQRVQDIRFADGSPATAYPGDPNQAGELNPTMVGGVIQPGRAARAAANNGAGGSGNPPMDDGGGGADPSPNPDCGNANACFKYGRRWNTRIPGRVQIRKVDLDEWELSSDDGDMITEAEVKYAKERLERAHDAFFEHWASRPNYGKIMLMTDPYKTEIVDGKRVVRNTDKPKVKQSSRAAGAASSHGTNAKNKKVEAQFEALGGIDWEYMEDVERYVDDPENNDPTSKNSHNAFKNGLQHVKRIYSNLDLSSDSNRKMFLRALARWWRAQCALNGWAPWNNQGGPYHPEETYKPRTINLAGRTKGKFEGKPYKYSYTYKTKLSKGAKAEDKLKQLIVEIIAVHFTEGDGNSDQKRLEAGKESAQWLDMLVYVLEQVAGVDLSAPAPADEPAITKDVLMARLPPAAAAQPAAQPAGEGDGNEEGGGEEGADAGAAPPGPNL